MNNDNANSYSAYSYNLPAVASLGLVSPGAANDGGTLFFLRKNWRPLGLDQSLDLSLVLDQIAGVRSNSVLSWT